MEKKLQNNYKELYISNPIGITKEMKEEKKRQKAFISIEFVKCFEYLYTLFPIKEIILNPGSALRNYHSIEKLSVLFFL